MQHENNRQRLERAFPPMDAAFDHAVRSTLENIVQEPARRWQWAAA